jgi:hypothetical protein
MEKTTLKSNWPRLLHAFIESRRSTPFRWGRNDCCIFAADAMLAITGEDPMAEHRGYRLAREAMKIIGGSKQLFNFAGTVLIGQCYRAVPLAFATLGDVVGIIQNRRQTLGVHLGNVIAAPGKRGVEFLRTTEILHAWRAE